MTYYRDSGQTFDTSNRTLHKALAKAGYIVPGSESGKTRYEIQQRCGGEKRRVLRVPLAVLVQQAEADISPLLSK